MASLQDRRARSWVPLLSIVLGVASAHALFDQQNAVGGGTAMMLDGFLLAFGWMFIIESLREWRGRGTRV